MFLTLKCGEVAGREEPESSWREIYTVALISIIKVNLRHLLFRYPSVLRIIAILNQKVSTISSKNLRCLDIWAELILSINVYRWVLLLYILSRVLNRWLMIF